MSIQNPSVDVINNSRINIVKLLIIISLLLLSLLIGVGYTLGYFPIRTFDAAVWRESEISSRHDRLQMIEPLVWSGELDGLTRQEVIDLLGSPSDVNYFNNWDLVYWLGPQRTLFSMDSEWLVLRFGASGRVSEYRVVSD